jgi:hypothetical protein
MFEKLIVNYIISRFGDFIEDFDPSKLSIGVIFIFINK